MWQRIYKARSQYQLIELFYDEETGHLQMHLNCCVQFQSLDEYRYHELAILSALLVCPHEPKRVLILGGGDGLAAREALKFADRIDLVDIDPEVTRLAKEHELIRALNQDSLNNEKVRVYNKDAYEWIKECRKNKYDIIFADYPDPSSPSLEKLFSLDHYAEMKRVLKPNGVLVVQAGGALMLPLMANIGAKLRTLFKYAIPMKVEMLNGIQGFWLACDSPKPNWDRLKNIETKAFDKQMFLSATSWSKDLREMLKQANPNVSAYDMYVYATCLLAHWGEGG